MKKELDGSALDDSLTNIQWLGRMSTDGLGPDPLRKVSNKENRESCQQLQQVLTAFCNAALTCVM